MREAPIPIREPSQFRCPSCPVRDFRDFYEEDMEVLQRQMPRVYFQKKCPRFFSKLKKTPHVWRLPPDYGLRRDPILDLFLEVFGLLFWQKNEKNAKSNLHISGEK